MIEITHICIINAHAHLYMHLHTHSHTNKFDRIDTVKVRLIRELRNYKLFSFLLILFYLDFQSYMIERSWMGKLKVFNTTGSSSHNLSFDMPEVTRGVSYDFRVKTTQANANFSSSITVNIRK